MRKFLLTLLVFLSFGSLCFANETLSVNDLNKMGIVSNSSIKKSELNNAKKIILQLQKENLKQIKEGYGPFRAAIYDENGHLVAEMSNTVIKEQSSLNHAEMNTIKLAHKNLKTYNLTPYHLSLYITAEPCMMCAGGIMWSGLEKVYYSVPSYDVEKITGFDEGYKPDWINAFAKRNIKVYGNIDVAEGKKVLEEYVNSNKEIYKPTRKTN